MLGGFRIDGIKPSAVPHIGSVTVLRGPFTGQVAAIFTAPQLRGIFGIINRVGHEITATATQDNIHAIAIREFQQLAGNIFNRGTSGQVGIGLPVAVANMGILTAGVACVIRAVETTPVDMPRSSARSRMVLTLLAAVTSALGSFRSMD